MANQVVRLGLVGFGSVGRAFAALLVSEGPRLQGDHGLDLRVTGLVTGRYGSITSADGIDLAAALERARSGRPHGEPTAATDFAASCPADAIVETLPLEPLTGAAAIAVTRSALSSGRHVVSANKGPVAHALRALRAIAAQNGVSYRYESTVADGMPVFNLIEYALRGAQVTGFLGLLNSTTALVLDALAQGQTVISAVESAQALGIAEADPSYDLDGWDAAVKLAALSAAVWDAPLALEGIVREPVDEQARSRAVAARAAGKRLVALATLRQPGSSQPGSSQPTSAGGAAEPAVRLVEIGPEHRFYALTGTSLGLQIESRLLCPITVSSQAPTVRDTAYGLLSDVLTIARA